MSESSDVSPILEPLNDAQRRAVTGEARHMLVLAGAGTGKTRVLTHRIAWLVRGLKVPPHSILATTFTNKAAREMRLRIEALLGERVSSLWAGTFHSISVLMLRIHWKEAGFVSADFQIMDRGDQASCLRRLVKEMDLKVGKEFVRDVISYISRQKERGLRADKVPEEKAPHYRRLLQVYEVYERHCLNANLADFDELLLRTLELFNAHPKVKDKYRRRFKHILIDEFQDTNDMQYEWFKRLKGPDCHVMVVGDEDQSIYGWRGAKVRNILDFDKDFKDTEVVRLEQNYRSTGVILSAANGVIMNNEQRLGKELWTRKEGGEKIMHYSAFNEYDEAEFVVQRVQQGANRHRYSDVAVLYRTTAQSRVIESALVTAGVPYQVYGGLRFYERAEIKDVLAYMSLVASRDNDVAFLRAIGTPTHGVGTASLEELTKVARSEDTSLWAAVSLAEKKEALRSRPLQNLGEFMRKINEMEDGTAGKTLDEVARIVLKESGLQNLYEQKARQGKGNEKAIAQVENLREFVNACAEYEEEVQSSGEETANILQDFLSRVVLDAGERGSDAGENAVQLMTAHSAKGLEFPVVFMVGMEQGLFPHSRSLQDENEMEEERRLCYVGMTRAREQLYMSWACSRNLYGSPSDNQASCFLDEIPEPLVRQAQLETEESGEEQETGGFSLGQAVAHKKFGRGVIVNLEGRGAHARAQVNFENTGHKWLVLSYAGLRSV